MKPVAWINIEDGNSILDWEKDEFAQKHYPLYDHLISELTDEEILDFEWAIKNVFNFSQNEKVVGLDRIIRAIIKKARE